MSQPTGQAAPRRAALIFIFVTVVLDVLALGIIVPVLPALVVEFLGGDTARAAETYGLFATAWALMQFVASPILGALSDRFGRRPIILTVHRRVSASTTSSWRSRRAWAGCSSDA